MDPLRLSGFSSNVDALNAAWETGAPLRLDRDLILEKDVEVTIGRGRRLELFGGRIVSAPGSLILNARKIATLGLAETVSQGDRGVTVIVGRAPSGAAHRLPDPAAVERLLDRRVALTADR